MGGTPELSGHEKNHVGGLSKTSYMDMDRLGHAHPPNSVGHHFRIIENTPSIYLLPMCWRWRCRARFRCSQFSNLIRASPLRRPDSFKTRDTPPDGIFNPRKKFAFHRVFKQSCADEMNVLGKFGDPNYIMIRALPGNSSYSNTRIFFNDFVAARPSKKFRIYNLHHVIKIAFEFIHEFSFNSDHVLSQGSTNCSYCPDVTDGSVNSDL